MSKIGSILQVSKDTINSEKMRHFWFRLITGRHASYQQISRRLVVIYSNNPIIPLYNIGLTQL